MQTMAVIFAPYLTWNREITEISCGKQTVNYPVDNWNLGTANAGASFDARGAMGLARMLAFMNSNHGPDFDIDGANHACADWTVAWDQGLIRIPSGLGVDGSIRAPDLGSIPIEILRAPCTRGQAKDWHFITMTISELENWARSLFVGRSRGPSFLFTLSSSLQVDANRLPSTDLDARFMWYAMLETLFSYELEGLFIGNLVFIFVDKDE